VDKRVLLLQLRKLGRLGQDERLAAERVGGEAYPGSFIGGVARRLEDNFKRRAESPNLALHEIEVASQAVYTCEENLR